MADTSRIHPTPRDTDTPHSPPPGPAWLWTPVSAPRLHTDLSTPVWTCAVTPTCGPSQWTPPAGQVLPPHCGSQAHMDTPVQPDTDTHRHTLARRLARRYWAQTPRPRPPHPPGPLGLEPPLPRSHVGGTSVRFVLRHTPVLHTYTHTRARMCAHTHVGVQPGLSAHSNPRCHGPLSQGLEEAPWQTGPLCICLALLSPKSQGPKPLTGLCVHFLQWQQAGGLGTGVCFSTILEPRCWESRCGQGHAPRGSRGGSSLSLPVSGGPWPCGHITHLHLHPDMAILCLCVSLAFL